MTREDIIKCKDELLVNLKLKGDYNEKLGLRKKTLLVEGITDKVFIERIKNDDTNCLSVGDFIRRRGAFSTSSPKKPEYNSKTVIVMILKHLSGYPEYIDFPKDAQNWPLYGLVDDDLNESDNYANVEKLFFTDTHDLETLMLFTDSELLKRLKQCRITDDEIKASVFIAMQLEEYRRAIRKNNELDVDLLKEPDGTINFGAFTQDNFVILEKLLDYINSKGKKTLPKGKIQKIRNNLIKDMKKLVDKEGVWKKRYESFVISEDGAIWMKVNGHEVLSAICYMNQEAREKFCKQGRYSLNREFELALSEAYNYDCFKKTLLYGNLNAAGLLNA